MKNMKSNSHYSIFRLPVITKKYFIVLISIIVCPGLFAQARNYEFETNINKQNDYILYYSSEKLNNFKTIHTSLFEINSGSKIISHIRGNNLKKKKPWINVSYELTKEEIDLILDVSVLKKFPEKHDKIYKSVKNRPIVTIYFKTPFSEIFIQWKGSKAPNRLIIFKLIKFQNRLIEIIKSKMEA